MTLSSSPENKTAQHTTQPQVSARRDSAAKARNRRIQDRVPINSQIVICCEGPSGAARSIRARAIDVSKAGLLAQSDQRVATGSVVLLQTVDSHLLGRACVRHCTPKGAKYWIGLYVPDRLLRTF